MPKSTKSYLVDTNVWVAIAYDRHIHHKQASAWFDTTGADQTFFCRQTQLGFLRLLTNSKVIGLDVMGQSKAWEVFDIFATDPRVGFLPEPDGVAAVFRRFTQGSIPATHVWNDAYLAAIADTTSMAIVTLDRAFAKFQGIDAVLV